MEAMKKYEKLQMEYNEIRELEKTKSIDKNIITSLTDNMASLLSNIEVDRQQWTALKESLKGFIDYCAMTSLI